MIATVVQKTPGFGKDGGDSQITAIHQFGLDYLIDALEKNGYSVELLKREELSQIDEGIAIAYGGDGTVLDLSHYVMDVPVIGVRSSDTSTGFFCCTDAYNIERILQDINTFPRTSVSRMLAAINGRVHPVPALNDILYTHKRPGGSSHFDIENESYVKTSGLLLSTAAGSTARMYQEGGPVIPIDRKDFLYHVLGKRDSGFHPFEDLDIIAKTHFAEIEIDGFKVSYDIEYGNVIEVLPGPELVVLGDLREKQGNYDGK